MTPPLILQLAAAWMVGLLAGYSGAPLAALGACGITLAVVAWMLERRTLAALLLVWAAATLAGRVAHRRERGCVHELSRRFAWVVRSGDAIGVGAMPRGVAREGSCSAAVRVAAVRGSARPGSWALVRGRATETPAAIVIDEATVRELRPPGVLARWRARADADIGRIFARDAPLARALLVANTRELSPELRDRWSAAGLVHMLSISGTHVAIIAAALELLLRAVRLPLLVARLSTLVAMALYVLALGAPPPGVRAAAMLGVVVITRVMDRPVSRWAPLAIGALFPLLDPATVLDIGWQLSVSGVAALICAAPLLDRLPKPWRRAGWRRTLAVGVVASSLASLSSAPLVAWHIGRVSLVGPLTNLVAAPLIALAQPALFVGMVLAPWTVVAKFVAAAVHPVLQALDAVAAGGASLPFASVEMSPTPWGAILAGACSLCVLAAAAMRDPARPLVCGTALLALLAWRPFMPAGSGFTELHVIDVGQGDAIAIRTARGRWVLVDAGPAWRGGDAGRSTVAPYVQRRGGTVEAIVLTHPHTDHVGGIPTVLRRLHPRLYLDAAYPGTAERYRASLRLARTAGVPWRRAHPADSLVVDEVSLRVLAPDSAWTASLEDPNEASTVLLVRVGRVRFLLTGDAERGEESWLVSHDPAALRAQVLKVGHHGSSTSTTPEFLAAVHPSLALVSVGAGNRYDHPSPAVLHALASAGSLVLRTDHLGSIVVRTDGIHLTIDADGDRWPCSTDSLQP